MGRRDRDRWRGLTRREQLTTALGLLLLVVAVVITALIASSRDGGDEVATPDPDTGRVKIAPVGAVAAPIVIEHGQWKCNGPQDGTIVIVIDPINVKKDPPEPYSAGATISDGCTGTIRSLIVLGNQRDGIKVGGTSRDVEILSGYVGCGPRAGSVHQDGIQAGGGTSVHFHEMHIDCPQSNNAGMFINQTNGGSGIRPTDITCTGCDLLAANNALNVGADSTGSGARFSILRKGTGSSAPANCKRVNGTDAVDQANECVDPNPAIDTGQPVQP